MQRAYPNNDIPAEVYFSEWKRASSHALSTRATGSKWTSMGPTNGGGRTLCIAFNPQNPNTIYAGSASGGLWRSYHLGEGNTWERVPTGFPVLGVSSVAIDPMDTNIMYIGTGEVYNYVAAGNDAAYRSERGSYGMGGT